MAQRKGSSELEDSHMRDFDQQYPNARAVSGKASWPRGVHKLSQIGLEAKWSRSPVRSNLRTRRK
jgi:hypothetical protein